MIIFKKLRYMNFLSTGNQWTEIDYLAAKTTLVVGSNGMGKSTGNDALTYALYGRAFRNINLPQLINSITNKGLLVEVEFSVGSREYKVVRGMKPGIFKIYIDDEEMKSRGPKDDQKYLEDVILKMNLGVFKQVVILSATAYKPFMTLPAADRRKVVDNLLDVEILTSMGALLKTKIDSVQDELSAIDVKIDIAERTIEIENKRINSLQESNDLLIAEKHDKIKSFRDIIDEYNLEATHLSRQVSEIMSDMPNEERAIKRKQKILQLETSIDEKRKKLKHEIRFFEEHDDCPTCKQLIDSEFKSKEVNTKKSKYDELDDALKQLEEELNLTSETLLIVANTNKQITELNTRISSLNQEIRFKGSYINDLEAEIESLKKRAHEIKTSDSQIDVLTSDLKRLNKERESIANDKAVMTVASKLLKDSGIKTKIVNQYIPIMNQLINTMLAKLDLFVEFTLDENFSETIKARHRDVFSYESFSEGEKKRIDLAILFTWRTIAKMRNSAATNLLVMDETFDGASDSACIDALVEILNGASDSENIIVISHSDKYNDAFDRIIRFEKNGSFSRMLEE